MSATHSLNSTASFAPVLYVAFELSSGQWKLASTIARGRRARVVSAQARNTAAGIPGTPYRLLTSGRGLGSVSSWLG
jgi:hypothetical protein